MVYSDVMPIKDYVSFVVTVALFLALPGPGNLAILAAYRVGGVRAAMVSTLGIAFGDQVLIVLALSGLATIVQEMPVLFQWIEYLGAAYLMYIGLGLLRDRQRIDKEAEFKMKRIFRQSVAVTLLNPKAIIFYMAFFPLFLERGQVIDLHIWFVLAGTIAIMTLLYGVVLLVSIKVLSKTMGETGVFSNYLAKILGVMFIGLGIRLAFS